MADCDSSGNWIASIPWLLAILGWMVLNRQHNNRETRKEIRAKTDDLIEKIGKVSDLGIAHHTTGDELARRLEIKRLMTTISFGFTSVQHAGISLERRDDIVRELRSSITAENFDEDYMRRKADDPIVVAIGNAAAAAYRCLENGYSDRYHKKLWHRRFFQMN